MDTTQQPPENSDDTSTPAEDGTPNSLPQLPIASISLSLSSILPSHFLSPPSNLTSLFNSQLQVHRKVRVPSQIFSLSHLSLSSSLTPPKQFFKSTISANPLQNPLSLNPRRPSDPSNGVALRRASVVWFRNDLRVHDNESLTTANNESMSVLPVYCFDPRDYGKSSSGFDKTGPYRATFLIESVCDLRKSLQARGSNLVVRIGKPENVLVELAQAVGAEAVYAHREVSHDEVKAEEKIEASMKDEGLEVKYFWGSTLYHLEDLPFKLEEMPTNYGGFKEKVKGLEVRKTIEALDQLKGLPAAGDVEPGEIPSLVDLGLNPNATMGQTSKDNVSIIQNGKPAPNASLVGGETEALERLRRFSAEFKAQSQKSSEDGTNESIYGANFSCKISPWLATGCLSPRSIFDELKKSISRTLSATSGQNNGSSGSGTGLNWLMYELLWRDFFRFITKKYSTAKLQNAAPVTACTGAAPS